MRWDLPTSQVNPTRQNFLYSSNIYRTINYNNVHRWGLDRILSSPTGGYMVSSFALYTYEQQIIKKFNELVTIVGN